MLVSAIQRLGLAFVHCFHAGCVRVQNARAVLEIISNDQIHMSVAIKVALHRAIGKPAFAAPGKFGCGITRASGGKVAGVAQMDDWRAPPEIDEHIHQPVLVKVSGERAHRGRRRSVIR